MSSLSAISNDEPVAEDLLGRVNFSTAFARIAETCRPPLVVGLYGDWGSGKTTLMRLIADALDTSVATPVWFDPWQHQFDESPVLALMHTMIEQLELGEEGRKLLTVIAAAFGSVLLNAVANVSADDIARLGERYEDERFMVRDARVRLRERFGQLIGQARGNSNRRLVFFIDDLDRCLPESTLLVLEALKLYLNLDGCVYFLGVDRNALQRSIAHHYKGSDDAEHVKYLDKIVQLPFTMPPVPRAAMAEYVESLLVDDLAECSDQLVSGLGDNPRSVKRFVNLLALSHEIAQALTFESYSVENLVAVLMIQYRTPELYRKIAGDPTVISQISSEEHAGSGVAEALELLRDVHPEELARYLHLTTLTTEPTANPAFMKPMVPDEALAAVVGSKPIPRTEVTKRLWAYIKRHELQDTANRRMIHADDKLRLVFDGKKSVSMFEMTKLVSDHMR